MGHHQLLGALAIVSVLSVFLRAAHQGGNNTLESPLVDVLGRLGVGKVASELAAVDPIEQEIALGPRLRLVAQ